MPESRIIDRVKELLGPIVLREGLRVYDVQWISGGKPTLRVFICRPQGDKAGVSIDDCSRVSQALSLQLDVEDFIQCPYDLEVSSPGIERTLTEPWHFSEAQGEKVRIHLQNHTSLALPDLKARVVEGRIELVQGDVVTLRQEEGSVQIPLAAISKARVIFDFGRENKKPGKKTKSKEKHF